LVLARFSDMLARREQGERSTVAAATKPPKGQPQYDAGGDGAHLAMTTNERLGYFGLSDDYDQAARARDREGMIAALKGARFDQQDAEAITDTVLSNPVKYGF
jgi:hypothetical protein